MARYLLLVVILIALVGWMEPTHYQGMDIEVAQASGAHSTRTCGGSM